MTGLNLRRILSDLFPSWNPSKIAQNERQKKTKAK